MPKKKKEPVMLDWHETKIRITEKPDGEIEVKEVPLTKKDQEKKKKKTH